MKKAVENARDAFQLKFEKTAEAAGFMCVRRCNKNTIMFAESEETYDAYVKGSQIIKKVLLIVGFLLLTIVGGSVCILKLYPTSSAEIFSSWCAVVAVLLITTAFICYKYERRYNEYEHVYENDIFYDEKEKKFYKLEKNLYPYQEAAWL